jgi:hypothetical protein
MSIKICKCNYVVRSNSVCKIDHLDIFFLDLAKRKLNWAPLRIAEKLITPLKNVVLKYLNGFKRDSFGQAVPRMGILIFSTLP